MVLRYMSGLTLAIPWMQMAKSFVILPESTVSMHDCSSSLAKRDSSGLLSSLARCSSPRVQANIDAIGLVDVDLPFWCSLQVTKHTKQNNNKKGCYIICF